MTYLNFVKFKSLLNFIKSRLQTEKANNILKKNIHTFLVDKHIKKDQIKLIFKNIYNIGIYNISTCMLPKKTKKKKNILGAKPQYKKVYIRFNSSIH